MTWRTAVTYDGVSAVVAVTGEIDMASEAALREVVDSALEREPSPAEITIDLSEVSFLDSAGVRALLVCRGRAADRGARLLVRDPQPTVASVLQITRVNDLFGLPVPAEPQRPRRPR